MTGTLRGLLFLQIMLVRSTALSSFSPHPPWWRKLWLAGGGEPRADRVVFRPNEASGQAIFVPGAREDAVEVDAGLSSVQLLGVRDGTASSLPLLLLNPSAGVTSGQGGHFFVPESQGTTSHVP